MRILCSYLNRCVCRQQAVPIANEHTSWSLPVLWCPEVSGGEFQAGTARGDLRPMTTPQTQGAETARAKWRPGTTGMTSQKDHARRDNTKVIHFSRIHETVRSKMITVVPAFDRPSTSAAYRKMWNYRTVSLNIKWHGICALPNRCNEIG